MARLESERIDSVQFPTPPSPLAARAAASSARPAWAADERDIAQALPQWIERVAEGTGVGCGGDPCGDFSPRGTETRRSDWQLVRCSCHLAPSTLLRIEHRIPAEKNTARHHWVTVALLLAALAARAGAPGRRERRESASTDARATERASVCDDVENHGGTSSSGRGDGESGSKTFGEHGTVPHWPPA